MVCPTERKSSDAWWNNRDVFQPTASGRAESALFGSVRTERVGRHLLPSFHEGIDLAPARKDARGRALDEIVAAADGVVAYANRIAGNSNYGQYVVLVHDTTAGELYTLYAHLSRIAPEVKAGRAVRAGDVLGVMGNTSSSPLPPARAHLHFEIGLIASAQYGRWHRAQRLKPDHGIYNGGNLIGIDPLEVFQAQAEDQEFMFLTHLAALPRAFEIVLATPHLPDYFRRYPRLWEGPAFDGRGLVMAVSENGLPLRGWNTGAPDLAELGKKKWRVRQADADVLGRNGCRLVVRRDGEWTLGAAGERWLEILAYP